MFALWTNPLTPIEQLLCKRTRSSASGHCVNLSETTVHHSGQRDTLVLGQQIRKLVHEPWDLGSIDIAITVQSMLLKEPAGHHVIRGSCQDWIRRGCWASKGEVWTRH